MAHRERLMVYPFDFEFSPILRCRELLPDYDITALVSPNGWGMNGKDAGYADNGSDTGLKVGSGFDEALGLCDTVLFMHSYISLDFNKVLYSKINTAVENGKNIISAMDIDEKVENEIRAKCEKAGVYFRNFNFKMKTDIQGHIFEYEEIAEINTPVIFILGTGERTNKFGIQLALRSRLIKMGYKISQIGSRNYCEMLGFRSFPGFMNSTDISEAYKVILFNHHVKKIEIKEKPDLIIIGIPGGIMPFNNMFSNGFGILAYEVSQAVNPDIAVFSMLYEKYTPEYFELMNATTKYKFGYEIDCFNLANARLDWIMSKQSRKLSYGTFDSDFVDKSIKSYSNLKTPVYNALNPGDADDMADFIVGRLAGEQEVKYL